MLVVFYSFQNLGCQFALRQFLPVLNFPKKFINFLISCPKIFFVSLPAVKLRSRNFTDNLFRNFKESGKIQFVSLEHAAYNFDINSAITVFCEIAEHYLCLV